MSRPLITVNTLVAQVRAEGRVRLPAQALITPAAADWLQGTRVPVERSVVDAAPVPDAPTIYFIGDGGDPYIQTLVTTLERTQPGLRFLTCNNRRECLLAHLETMVRGMAECADRRGVIVVQKGAIAACVANRAPHVQAAILQQPSDLFTLQRELGVNLLIIEKERTAWQQARAAIESFLRGTSAVEPRVATALQRAVSATAAAASCTCDGA